jgi:hypothetical protein
LLLIPDFSGKNNLFLLSFRAFSSAEYTFLANYQPFIFHLKILGIFRPNLPVFADYRMDNLLFISTVYFYRHYKIHFLFPSWEIRFCKPPTFAEV